MYKYIPAFSHCHGAQPDAHPRPTPRPYPEALAMASDRQTCDLLMRRQRPVVLACVSIIVSYTSSFRPQILVAEGLIH